MDQIKTISKPSMKNGIHFTFVEAFVALVKEHNLNNHEDGKLTDRIQELFDAFQREDEVFKLAQASTITQRIADADYKRDRAWGSIKVITAAFSDTGTDQQKAAAERVKAVVRNYNIDVNTAFDQESALLTNAIADLEKVAADLETLHIANLLTDLKTANEEVKRSLAERNKERSETENGQLKAARAESDRCYDAVVLYLNAKNVLSETAEFDTFIRQWNANIARVRTQDFTAAAPSEPTIVK